MKYLAIIVALLMTGCATTTVRTVESVETKIQPIPDQLLTDCTVTPPPAVDKYMSLDLAGRENILINYSQSLLVDLKNCKNKIIAIRNWQSEVTKLDEHKD